VNNESPEDRIVMELWQNQKTEGVRMSVEQVRSEAGRFERRIRSRNLREYLAALFVILSFGYMFTRMTDVLLRVGFGLEIVGASYVIWHLLTKGSPGAMAGNAGRSSWIEFRRAELVRQRDLLGSIWRWYLGPLAPGLVVQMVAQGRINPSYAQHPGLLVATGVVMAAMFVGIGRLNARGAEKLQRQIDELDEQSRG
jgi:hypothetical protein